MGSARGFPLASVVVDLRGDFLSFLRVSRLCGPPRSLSLCGDFFLEVTRCSCLGDLGVFLLFPTTFCCYWQQRSGRDGRRRWRRPYVDVGSPPGESTRRLLKNHREGSCGDGDGEDLLDRCGWEMVREFCPEGRGEDRGRGDGEEDVEVDVADGVGEGSAVSGDR